MVSKKRMIAAIASTTFLLSFAITGAASALTSLCVGVPSASNITWTASYSDGVAPIAFLWGNGSTSSVQTIAEVPGTYSMTLTASDASSSMATTTCAATVASTTSTGTTIQVLIQNLLNQIATLKAQIVQLILQQQGGMNGGTATSTVTCIKFNKDLAFGDNGDDVKHLQQELSSDPSIFPPGLITGFFGHKTQEALKKFQSKWGIGTTTGFFGPKTRGFINGHCGNEHSVEMSTQKWTTATSSHDDQGENDNNNGKGKDNSHDD